MDKDQKFLVRILLEYGNYRYKTIYGEMRDNGEVAIYDNFADAQLIADAIMCESEPKPPIVDELINHFARMVLGRRIRTRKPEAKELLQVRRLITIHTHVIYADDPLLAYHLENHRISTALYRAEKNELERERDLLRQTYTFGIAAVAIIVLLLMLMWLC